MSSQENLPDDSPPPADPDPAAETPSAVLKTESEVKTDEPEVLVVTEPVDISDTASFFDEEGLDKGTESIVGIAISSSKTNLETTSAMNAIAAPEEVVQVEAKPIPKHYYISDSDQGGSLAYEKDGSWVLAKVPPYTFKPKKGRETNNNEIPFNKCCLEKSTEPPSLGQNMKAIYDVVIGGDSIPCNECDKNLCKETLLQWLTSIVVTLVETVKEISAVIPTSSSACGSTDADTLKLNTKGTHVDLLEDSNSVNAISVSLLSFKDTAESNIEIASAASAADKSGADKAEMLDESGMSLEASRMAAAATGFQSSSEVAESTIGAESQELQIELVETQGDEEGD